MQPGRHRFVGARLCLAIAGALVLSALTWIPSTLLVADASTTGWSIVSSPNVGTQGDRFSADSCVSTTFCMAGGFFYDPAGTAAETLAEEWNGAHWAQVTTPNASSDDFFSGMSCVSTTFCVAVGEQFTSGARPEPHRAMERHGMEHRDCARQDRKLDGTVIDVRELHERHILHGRWIL